MNTLLIVDDHILFREGLHNIINHWEDFEVVGEAANGKEALELAQETLPDVILMDITMPVMNGIEATQKITRELPTIKVVILTMSDEESNLFEAIKSGAHGYVLKDTPSRRLRDQLIKLLEGETPISGLMATKILHEFQYPCHKSNSHLVIETEPLSEREQQVLGLVVDGMSNGEIAQHLFLSENTIKKYMHNIFEKLHLNNRVEAVTYALREGLVDK